MGNSNNPVTLYSAQAEIVVNTLEQDGICFSKRQYVTKKYEEVASTFTAAYSWFVREAEQYVRKPEGAEYPYWAFKDLQNIELSSDTKILKLAVPKDEIVFFDMYDWNKILCLQYIGNTKTDEERFRQMVFEYGVRLESDIMLTNFYPDLKKQVEGSWRKLFRHHENIKNGNISEVESVQVGLWRLKKEWLI